MTNKRLVFLALSVCLLGIAFFYYWTNRKEALNISVPTSLVSQLVQANQAKEIGLDQVIERAEKSLARFRSEIRDFTATMTKRERINGKILDAQSMQIKIICRTYGKLTPGDSKPTDSQLSSENDKIAEGLHAYLRFLSPPNIAGREVIWVEGQNKNQMIAHEAGFFNVMSVHLDPNGSMAMAGSKYPITEIGIEKLLVKLIERGKKDLPLDTPQVTLTPNSMLDDVPCDRIRILHPTKKEGLDFHIAEILIDTKTEIPVYYASYDWPEKSGGEPPLLEEYGYHDLKTNVGLQANDFDPKNKEYNFP